MRDIYEDMKLRNVRSVCSFVNRHDLYYSQMGVDQYNFQMPSEKSLKFVNLMEEPMSIFVQFCY